MHPSEAWVQSVFGVLKRHIPRLKKADCAVIFVGKERMRRLNREYHGTDRPTDVLAFPAKTAGKWRGRTPEELGDIFLCWPYLVAQAKRFGVTAEEECARLLVHGVLHVLGYLHDTTPGAKRMFGMQEKMVAEWRDGQKRVK